MIILSEKAVTDYESLRKQFLDGSSLPQGLCVVIYHGLLRGLHILSASLPPSRTPHQYILPSTPSPFEDEFVQLLANLVLTSQCSEEIHHVH